MASTLWLALSLWLLLSACEGGKQMAALSKKKLCADPDCSREYSRQAFAVLLNAVSEKVPV